MNLFVERDIPDLTKSDGTGAEPVGLLDTTSGVLNTTNTRQGESSTAAARDPEDRMGEGHTYHGGLPCSLGGELLTRSLS